MSPSSEKNIYWKFSITGISIMMRKQTVRMIIQVALPIPRSGNLMIPAARERTRNAR
jgi:hypothetical protein